MLYFNEYIQNQWFYHENLQDVYVTELQKMHIDKLFDDN